jgi:hypothetical protein
MCHNLETSSLRAKEAQIDRDPGTNQNWTVTSLKYGGAAEQGPQRRGTARSPLSAKCRRRLSANHLQIIVQADM